MPDISMCQHKTCKLLPDCYRYMALPNPHRQAYMEFYPSDMGDCEDYIPLHLEQIHMIKLAFKLRDEVK